MDLRYMEDKDDAFKKAVWEMAEELNEKYPYLRFGWYGFMPMVIGR